MILFPTSTSCTRYKIYIYKKRERYLSLETQEAPEA